MLKLALFFVLGVAIGVAACWQFLSQGGQYEIGRRQGELTSKLALADAIKTLGTDYQQSDGHNTLFMVKDVEAVTVERNGIKTLRLAR
jgi:hypothetical protein